MHHLRNCFGIFIFLLLTSGISFSNCEIISTKASRFSFPSDSTRLNDGADPSQPITRIDLLNNFFWDWFEYKDDRFYNITQLNSGKAFQKGKLYLLLRIPVVVTNLTFESQTGLGDISFDIQYSTANRIKLNLIAGSEFIFPTESSNETGTGKFIAGPYAGVIDYFRSGYYGLVITQYFSYAGQNNRNDINELSINPLLKIDLGKNWYTLITPDLRYNFKSTNFFVPYTQQFGKLFSRNFAASVTGGFHIKNDNRYDVLSEIKLSYLF